MPITYKYFRSERDLVLQYDFWSTITSNLPYAWKPTKSPLMFKEQKEFDPRSRCFAYDDENLVGYMSFTGKGDFVSLGYPWVLPGYECIQDELYHRVYGFAVSKEYGGKILAQRFRKQWVDQIIYFEEKGFEITNESELIGCFLSDLNIPEDIEFAWNLSREFSFEGWKSIIRENEDVTEAQIKMMEEYYSSVNFDASITFIKNDQVIGIMGFTIREDTKYCEVLVFGISQEFEYLKESMIRVVMKEILTMGGRTIAFQASDVPEHDLRNELELTELTKDVMMVKEV